MAKGGIIMDVTTAEQARIAEEAGVRPLALGPNIHFHFLHTAGAANGKIQNTALKHPGKVFKEWYCVFRCC